MIWLFDKRYNYPLKVLYLSLWNLVKGNLHFRSGSILSLLSHDFESTDVELHALIKVILPVKSCLGSL